MHKKYILTIILILLSELLICQSKYPEMILVKGGTFKMGSTEPNEDAMPVHNVTLSDFYISKYEVTVEQYKHFCKETGHQFPKSPTKEWYDEHPNIKTWVWRNNMPIVNVSWNDAIEYCKWLSKSTGEEYSLPTEAQWEYAARGGKNSSNFKYSGSNTLSQVAWYDETTFEKGPRPVGTLKPNKLEIYDMSGNAYEFCYDFYAPYPEKSIRNPTGPSKGQYKVIRGGSWYNYEELCTVSIRDMVKPNKTSFYFGFRVVKNK